MKVVKVRISSQRLDSLSFQYLVLSCDRTQSPPGTDTLNAVGCTSLGLHNSNGDEHA